MIFVFIWTLFCCVPAIIASNKGRSGLGFFFLSFFLSPLIGFIAALIIDPVGKPVTVVVNQSQTVPIKSHNTEVENEIASLEKLLHLKENGVLSEAEFESEKSKILHKKKDAGYIDFNNISIILILIVLSVGCTKNDESDRSSKIDSIQRVLDSVKSKLDSSKISLNVTGPSKVLSDSATDEKVRTHPKSIMDLLYIGGEIGHVSSAMSQLHTYNEIMDNPEENNGRIFTWKVKVLKGENLDNPLIKEERTDGINIVSIFASVYGLAPDGMIIMAIASKQKIMDNILPYLKGGDYITFTGQFLGISEGVEFPYEVYRVISAKKSN